MNNDPEKLNFIFEKYNPNENEFNETLLYEFMYKYNEEQQAEFLTQIRSIFQKLERETNENQIKNAYEEINKYLNKLVNINSKGKLAFK